ncbi:MAG: hypothetical protein HOQ05_06520 [Corynebacteriales bacterium]|nr:hypothetical protein [Mycobacteriales bacterium]
MRNGVATTPRSDQVIEQASLKKMGAFNSWWRFAPGLAVLATAVVVLLASGVEPGPIFRFGLYFVFFIALPGTLLWRALGPTLTHRVEEYAVGAALGYAIEALARLAASALHDPKLSMIVPAFMVAITAAVPQLRRYWRSEAAPLSAGLAWSYALIGMLVLGWLWFSYLRVQPITWSGQGGPTIDLLYTLAYSAEAAQRWPVEFPWVAGEPLHYHWFIGLHLGGAHTATGIELPVLLFRLYLIPIVLVLIVATGAVATRLSGHHWVGPLAGGLAFLSGELELLTLDRAISESDASVVDSLLGPMLWWSPSMTYSIVVLMPAMLLLIDAVRDRMRLTAWIVLALSVAAATGAKGTAIPTVVAGLGFVVLVGAVVRRTLLRQAALALGLASVAYLLADYFIYGQQKHGIAFDPFGYSDNTVIGSIVNGAGPVRLGLIAGGAVAALGVFAHMAPWLGAVLLAGKSTRDDAAAWLTAGFALVAVGSMVLLYHPGQSQLSFSRGLLPFLAAAAAWGVSTKMRTRGQIWVIGHIPGLPGPRSPHSVNRIRRWQQVRSGGVLVLALVAGVAIGAAIMRWYPVGASDKATRFTRFLEVATPFALVFVGAVVVAGVYLIARTAMPKVEVGALAVLVLVIAGAGAVRIGGQGLHAAYAATGRHVIGPSGTDQMMDFDVVRAAQWLKDNSAVDDVVMTNIHCAGNTPYRSGERCDNLSFWVSAYSERRTLVEGWGYTARNAEMAAAAGNRNYGNLLPFWNPGLLERNDAFLAKPTLSEAQVFRHDYGVRWILVTATHGPVSPKLDRVAQARFTAGPATVYEIR